MKSIPDSNEQVYHRYTVLADGDIYAKEIDYIKYIPLTKEKKHYTYWRQYFWDEIKYQLRKFSNLFNRKIISFL